MKEIKMTNSGTYDIPSETVSDGYRLVLAPGLHSLEDGNYPGRLYVSRSIAELRAIAEDWEDGAPIFH